MSTGTTSTGCADCSVCDCDAAARPGLSICYGAGWGGGGSAGQNREQMRGSRSGELGWSRVSCEAAAGPGPAEIYNYSTVLIDTSVVVVGKTIPSTESVHSNELTLFSRFIWFNS